MFRLIEPSSGQFTNHTEEDEDDDGDNNNKLFAGGIFIQIMLIHNCICNISKHLINLTQKNKEKSVLIFYLEFTVT
jgi:hypothetical protein